MKILIFVEVDVVVRHFIVSGAFKELVAAHDVTFIFPEAGHRRMGLYDDVSKLDLGGAPFEHLPVHHNRQKLWKPLFQVDRLRWRPGRQYAGLRRLVRSAIGPKMWPIYTFLGLPGVFAVFQKLVYRWLARTPYTGLEALLDRLRPDVIVHPCVLEGEYINDLVETAGWRGIPLVAIMNSWDNPSSKKAMAGQPDWLLVWGQQTFEHSVEYVGMRPQSIVKFGAAQFDVYREPPRMDRAAFCQAHHIDPATRILLYAGSSKGTDEFAHLREIDELIERGTLPDTIVVYRPHPWGDGGRGGERIFGHSWRHVRIESSMRAYLGRVNRGDHSKSMPDYRDARDVLCAIDAMVSPLSTILLEGALLGKPVMCFLPEEEDDARHFQLAMPQVHFDAMFDMPDVMIARSRESMLEQLPTLVDRVGDEARAERQKRAVAFFVEPFDEPFAKRFVCFIEECVAAERKAA